MASSRDTLSSRLRRHRRKLDSLAAIFWALFFLFPYGLRHFHIKGGVANFSMGGVQAIDNFFADQFAQRGRLTPQNPDIVFLGIDDASVRLDSFDPDTVRNDPILSSMLNWPWPRPVYAPIYDRLANAGAKVVIFDILFLAPKSGDEDLKAALDRHPDQFILGCNIVSVPNRKDETLAPVSDTIIPQTSPPDSRTAFVNFWPDEDNTIRQALFHRRYNGAAIGQVKSSWIIDSMAARAMQMLGRTVLIPRDTDQHPFRFTGGSRCFATYSVCQMFEPHAWKNNFQDGAFFKDKIVMVGPKGDFMQDEHHTPFGRMDGAEIHLQALNAALHSEFFWVTSRYFRWMFLLVAAAALFAWTIVRTIKGVAFQSAAATFGGLAYIAMADWLFDYNIIPAIAAPIGTLFLTMVTTLTGQFLLEQVERTRTRRVLERYVSQKVAHEILDNPASYVDSLVGRRRPVTVLFSDLRGFTSMMEGADSEQFVRVLNEYLQEMTRVIFEHEGILDKFIGDAVMAVWGSFTPRPEQDTRSAVLTALGMHRALAEFNERREEGSPAFAMGVGINYGDAIVGDIGSSQKTNFTVIGDSVNLASRLESLTKEYGVETLISESVATLVRPHFHLQAVDYVRVKGRQKPVEVFAVHGVIGVPLEPKLADHLARFEAAFQLYRGEHFAEAKEGFAACLQIFPDNKLAKLYHERSEEFTVTPPEKSWDGVYVMTHK